MSKEVIMRDFTQKSNELLKGCTEQELIVLMHKVEREMNERMEVASGRYLKGDKYKLTKG